MKTLHTITIVIMITLSLNAYADDNTKMLKKNKNSLVSVAPFVWGDPETEAPAGLEFLKAKYALVPIVPMVWGNPEDGLSREDKIKLLVPAAPFIWGDPDSDAPSELNLLIAVNSDVAVATFVWGSLDENIPEVIELL